MHIKEKLNKVKEIIKSDEMDLVYRLLALIVGLCIVLAFVFSKNNETKAPSDIRAEIKGAVNNPGVYTLKDGSRIEDLIKAAGGVTENADTDEINAAEYVLDAEEIYIPEKVKTENAQLIDINSASADILDKLPGIGPALSKKIIEYRTKYGAFPATDCIMNVDGIGESQYKKIKNLITAN